MTCRDEDADCISTLVGEAIGSFDHALRTPLGVALTVLRDLGDGLNVGRADILDAVHALERIESLARGLRAAAEPPPSAAGSVGSATLVARGAELAARYLSSRSGAMFRADRQGDAVILERAPGSEGSLPEPLPQSVLLPLAELFLRLSGCTLTIENEGTSLRGIVRVSPGHNADR